MRSLSWCEAQSKEIEYRSVPALMDQPASVRGDRVQVQQVVLNLILNAVEAMSSVEEGVRELSISTEPTQASSILIAVRDTGPGIDPEYVDRVFKPFYTTKSTGIGMGLSICRSIIDAHGGRLWAEANRPRGATFQFTLPASIDDSMSAGHKAPRILGPNECTARDARRPRASGDSRQSHPSRRGYGECHPGMR